MEQVEGTLWNFEKSSSMPKIWQKIKKNFVQMVQLDNTFKNSFRIPENPISGIQYITNISDKVLVYLYYVHFLKAQSAYT